MSEHNEKGNEVYKTLCSLGVSNIKNYQPYPGEKIIIAADNDGAGSNTVKTIESAKQALEEKGAFVEIVRPEKEGDFNDVLKSEGTDAIREAFKPALAKQTATSLALYLGESRIAEALDDIDKANLAYIQGYKFSEEKIVDAYRKGDIHGKIELDNTRKRLETGVRNFNNNEQILNEAKRFGYNSDSSEIVRSLIGMDEDQARSSFLTLRNETIKSYFTSNLSALKERSRSGKYEDQKLLIKEEQTFLRKAYSVLDPEVSLSEYSEGVLKYISAGEAISKNPEKLEKFFGLYDAIKAKNISSEADLSKDMSSTINIDELIESVVNNQEVRLLNAKANEVKSVSGYLSVLLEQQQLAFKVNKDNSNKPTELSLRLIDLTALESLTRDCNFLIENKIETDEELLKVVRNSDDLKSVAGNLFNKVQPYVRLLINNDLNKLEDLDQRGKGKKLLEMIAENDEKYQKFYPHFKDDVRATVRFKRINNRAEVYTIIAENQTANPELTGRFKEEMDTMDRFNYTGVEAVFNLYKDKGLAKVVEYASSSNKNYVLKRLDNQYIIGDYPPLKDEEYVKALANDKEVMRYIDKSIDENIELNPFRKSKYCLMDYRNQRDINAICNQLSEKTVGAQFKEKALDLQTFGNSQQLREGLEIYKTRNVEFFVKYAETTCANSIAKRIQGELVDIAHGSRIESFHGKKYQNKSDYLQSISENKQVIKYIEKNSNIGKEIEALQKSKSLDFER